MKHSLKILGFAFLSSLLCVTGFAQDAASVKAALISALGDDSAQSTYSLGQAMKTVMADAIEGLSEEDAAAKLEEVSEFLLIAAVDLVKEGTMKSGSAFAKVVERALSKAAQYLLKETQLDKDVLASAIRAGGIKGYANSDAPGKNIEAFNRFIAGTFSGESRQPKRKEQLIVTSNSTVNVNSPELP